MARRKITKWKMALDSMTSSIFLIMLPFLNVISAHSNPTLKKCGEVSCAMYEYCSRQELTCKPCEEVCIPGTPNYGELYCQRECQEYIHDVQIGYARKSDLESLAEEINKIYAVSVVTLILVVILIVIGGGVLVKRLYQYRKRVNVRKLEQKKFQQKLSSVQYTISNNNSKIDDSMNSTMRTSMRTKMPSTMTLTTQTDESPHCTNKSTSTTKTLPLSVEEPSEDTTLDYAAYVNQALSHSPPSEVHLCPTKLDIS